MKGHPKYKVGDKVIINLHYFEENVNEGEHIGEIYIIDENGTYENPSDVSYDVMIHDFKCLNNQVTDCLCKHFTESTVRPYTG